MGRKFAFWILVSLALSRSAFGFGPISCTATGNSNDPASGACTVWQSCATPKVSITYQLSNSGCDFRNGVCDFTATAQIDFPGNRFNPPSNPNTGFTDGVIILDPNGANYTCFVSNNDSETVVISGGFQCGQTATQPQILQVTMCPDGGQFGCAHQTGPPIDPVGTFCAPPPDSCTEDGAGGPPGAPGSSPGSAATRPGGDSAGEKPAAGAGQDPCRLCKPGGGGTSQSASGGGPAAEPASTGPGALLRYRAGGVGGAGFPGTAAWTPRLGRYWSHDYAERIVLDPNPPNDASHVWMLTRHGVFREFQKSGASPGTYTIRNPVDEYRVLTYAGSGAGCGAGVGWQLKGLDGTVEYFRGDGYWCQTVDRDGNTWAAVYDAVDPTQLDQVNLPDGRQESFAYSGARLATIEEVGVGASPPTRTWTYTWGTGANANDLVQIDRPDGTSWQFRYDDTNHPGYLTRVSVLGTDHTSGRIEAGFDYDTNGNTAHMWKGDVSFGGPAAVDQYTFTYTNPVKPTQTVVTDPLGVNTTYALDWSAGTGTKARITQINGDCGACGLSPTVYFTYTDPNNPLLPTSMTDGNGNVTAYTYDTPAAFNWVSDGRLKTKTEAQSTAIQRLTTWTYGNANFPSFPTQVDMPSTDGVAGHTRTMVFGYDSTGNLQTRTANGFEAGSSFTYPTGYSYNTPGQVTSVDPPGFGTTDQTTYAYSVPSTNGQVPSSRTDPLVGATSFGYDAFNRLITTTDPNGAVTETQYDLLNRTVASVRHFQLSWTPGSGSDPNDLVTTYLYDCPAGSPPDAGTFPPNVQTCHAFRDLRCVQLPNGNGIEYLYDSSNGRLVYVRRKSDCSPATQPMEQTVYSYNNAGNRTRESLQRWTGSAWVEDSGTRYSYSVMCHVDTVTRGDGSATTAVTDYCYDKNNNLTKLWDADHAKASFPATPSQTMTYDALNRLTQVQLGSGETTSYLYDVQDHLEQVTDAETNVTTYTTSDRDLMTSQSSPVTGATSYVYDPHGQLTSQTDARNIVTRRTLDVLDRVTTTTYGSDTSLTTQYTYDDPLVSFSKGRLTAINKGGGASVVNYTYDLFGRALTDGALGYAYDKNGNRTQILYPGSPSPVSACYGYDALDRQISLGYTTTSACASPTSLVSGVGYVAQGPVSGLTLGNGLMETRTFDARYYPTLVKATKGSDLLKLAYATDALGNVTSITDQTPANQSRTFGYQDYQYFLKCAAGPWSTTGSACSPSLTGGPQQWLYDTIGDRLSEQRTSTTDKDTYTYLSNGSHHNPKLQQIAYPGAVSQLDSYDPAGNVVQESGPSTQLDFLYDAAGKLAKMTEETQRTSVTLAYDGRGFLAKAQGSPTDCGPLVTIPTYDSAGTLYVREHRNLLGNNLLKDTWLFYFAGRPIAQLDGTNSATATLTYLTTDHLATPALATNTSGAATWSGGFEAFGRDWQAGGSNNALAKGIFLRFPGQWDDEAWSGSVKSGLYYNLNRWYAAQLGRYVAPDPVRLGKQSAEAFVYGLARPTRYIDPLGLFHIDSSCDNLACVAQHGYGNMLNAIQSETKAICGTLDQVIYDSALLKCVKQKCNSGKIYCRGADRDPTNACNDANAGGYGYPGGEATFCPGNWTYGVPPGYFGDLAIHEWSHNCGWEHGQGKGVPL